MEEKFEIQRMGSTISIVNSRKWIIGLNEISMYREENIINSNLAEIETINCDNLLILLKVRYIVYDIAGNSF